MNVAAYKNSKTYWQYFLKAILVLVSAILFAKVLLLVLTALSRISPRVRVRDSVSIVYRIAPGGYSWIWPY